MTKINILNDLFTQLDFFLKFGLLLQFIEKVYNIKIKYTMPL